METFLHVKTDYTGLNKTTNREGLRCEQVNRSNAQWLWAKKGILFGWLSVKGNPSQEKEKHGCHWASGLPC